ncbi:Secreted glycosyl hydrolase [Flavobacterium daejeonense]|nr:Secreted glycosyl hydrolase [Flavobacterium daejeonense]
MNTIYRLLLVTSFFISQNNNAQKRIALFNQKDLKGWYAFGEEKGKANNASELFSVENSMIRMYGPKAGYLMSEQSFRNFELTVEFRWNTDSQFAKKSNSKNSGVMYLVPSETPDVLWPKGIQFQIKEGATGDFVLLQEVTLNVNGTKTEAGKSVVSKRFADAEKPIGEWNKLQVISKNGVITQKLNGKLVNKGIESSVTEGRILLQYEGYPIDFRKVCIKKIK